MKSKPVSKLLRRPGGFARAGQYQLSVTVQRREAQSVRLTDCGHMVVA